MRCLLARHLRRMRGISLNTRVPRSFCRCRPNDRGGPSCSMAAILPALARWSGPATVLEPWNDAMTPEAVRPCLLEWALQPADFQGQNLSSQSRELSLGGLESDRPRVRDLRASAGLPTSIAPALLTSNPDRPGKPFIRHRLLLTIRAAGRPRRAWAGLSRMRPRLLARTRPSQPLAEWPKREEPRHGMQTI